MGSMESIWPMSLENLLRIRPTTQDKSLLSYQQWCWLTAAWNAAFSQRGSPMGLTSKKRTCVRRTALNMLLCRVCADFTSPRNITKLLMKPKTTAAAVKPTRGSRRSALGQTFQFYFTRWIKFSLPHSVLRFYASGYYKDRRKKK